MDKPFIEGGPLPSQSGPQASELLTESSLQSEVTHSFEATAVHKVVKENPSSGFPLVLQLLGPHGNRNFDQITKTKTVEVILASMDGKGITNYIDYLTTQMYDMSGSDTKDHAAVDSTRERILDQCLALIRNRTISKEDTWIVSILELMTVHSFFAIKHKSESSPYACVCARLGSPDSILITQVAS